MIVTSKPLAIVRTADDLRRRIGSWRIEGQSIGLVPTMGALHPGHLALVEQAGAECDQVVASIFVNPKQFGPREDYGRYPRQLEIDRAMLTRAGCNLLLLPDVETMYPPGFSTIVSVGGLTTGLCGAFRPGFFDGVATVVTKLFTMTLPDRAYFGEKDYQQLQMVRHLVRDLDLPIDIIGVATVREKDGLAISSRNIYLTENERTIAPKLFAVLNELSAQLADGTRATQPILDAARAQLLAEGFTEIDYLEAIDAETLVPLEFVDRNARIAAAVWIGTTRLIDNIPI